MTQKDVVGWVGLVLLGHAATKDLPIPRAAFVRPPHMLHCHPSLPSLTWHLAMCLLGLGGQKRICRDFLAAHSFLWDPLCQAPGLAPVLADQGVSTERLPPLPRPSQCPCLSGPAPLYTPRGVGSSVAHLWLFSAPQPHLIIMKPSQADVSESGDAPRTMDASAQKSHRTS